MEALDLVPSLRVQWRPGVEVAISKSDGLQGLRRVCGNRAVDGHTLSLINADGLDLRYTVLHGDLARARHEEDLARTLDI